jgi:ABC-type transporter Mla maintaining outer membrane lipid asymmetry ATPase subunit MlaF
MTFQTPLSLEIRRGQCLVLLGPSGIGKSTLLRLLIKTLNPERGSILFHGDRSGNDFFLDFAPDDPVLSLADQ